MSKTYSNSKRIFLQTLVVKVKTFTDSMNEHCDKDVMVAVNDDLGKCNNGVEAWSPSALQPAAIV